MCQKDVELSIDCHSPERCHADLNICGACGDGVTSPDLGEQCDDGNQSETDGCLSDCTFGPSLCGDGVLLPTELCDDGNNLNDDGCQEDCTHCGDGAQDPGEACDDGDRVGADGCSATCKIEVCGDGIIDSGEDCDDADTDDTDVCLSSCRAAVCGDGSLLAFGLGPLEQCDDGNSTNGDGCDELCQIENSCGDGIVNPGNLCFLDERRLDLGFSPFFMATADLNSDGAQDLIVPNQDNAQALSVGVIRVLLGVGDGSFVPTLDATDTPRPGNFLIDDLSNDGVLDLAVLHPDLHQLSVLLGNGDGTFQLPQILPTEFSPIAIAAGDFDNNTTKDLAALNFNSSTVSVFLGNGDGSFLAQLTSPTGTSPNSLVVVDLNQDNKQDLVITQVDTNLGLGTVNALLGDGAGVFVLQTAPLAQGTSTGKLVSSDLNLDGTADILFVNSDANQVGVLLGGLQEVKTFAAPGSPAFLAVGDLSADGFPDAVTAAFNASSMDILLGNGQGDLQMVGGLPVVANLFSVAMSDFNNDSALDIATATPFSNELSLILSNP